MVGRLRGKTMDWEQLTDRLGATGERVGRGLKAMFGSQNERLVRKLEPLVEEVAALEAWAQGLDAEGFKSQTTEWKRQVADGEAELDELMPNAFALVREASVRTLGLRHFDVQIVGGSVLHRGAIAEMMTGEGKTLVATLALYLNALGGKPVYLITVNDYLARRDCAWMKPIYDYLGVTSGSIQSNMGPLERKPVYDCDIVYGTNNEFGFDYLRDNMKNRVEEQVQRHLIYAIVDEVDSILIDEARTPLIISGPAEESSQKYALAKSIADKLERDVHYEVKEKERQASLLEDGIEVAEKMVGVDSFYTPGNEDWPHFIENAIRAKELYVRDDQYVVEPGERGGLEVVIVDEFTGRKMTGRRWSDGLHQAVEASEGIPPRQENQTLATITFQNYFRLFDKLAGMTGTALTEAAEFYKIYRLDVVSVPTNLPLARNDGQDIVYRTEEEKWKAIADEIAEVNEKGQPMLVGTTSVEKSEVLSGLLKTRGVVHEVLNAKNHEREASIVAHAGEQAAVTVATNMAGRGTDIKLGGNFEWRLKNALDEAELVEGDEEHLEDIGAIREKVLARCDADQARVLELGGLYVLGTERHEARRIDNQLRGRSGRQGDAGESRFFLSLQDDLMRRFYRDWVTNAMEKLGMSEGVPIESKMVSRAIEKAQKKVEDYNFEIRKSLLEYDEVMDSQRKDIYLVRQEVLESVGLRERCEDMVAAAVERASTTHVEDAEGFAGWFQRTFGFECSADVARRATEKDAVSTEEAIEACTKYYDEREEKIGDELMRRIEQYLLLNAIDAKWKDHLHAIDALKTGIGLRGYGQQDPKTEYKREGFELFQNLRAAVEDEVASLILRIRISGADGEGPGEGQLARRSDAPMAYHGPAKTAQPGAAPRRVAARPVAASNAFDLKRRNEMLRKAQDQAAAKQRGEEAPAAPPAPGSGAAAPEPAPATTVKEVGRNDSCPCGSGKKYKKCHGR
jgi:preprotein translocase subunit SecA